MGAFSQSWLTETRQEHVSMNSELRARLERLGPIRDAPPGLSSSDPAIVLIMRRTGPLDRPIDVARRLMRGPRFAPQRACRDNAAGAQGWAVVGVDPATDLAEMRSDRWPPCTSRSGAGGTLRRRTGRLCGCPGAPRPLAARLRRPAGARCSYVAELGTGPQPPRSCRRKPRDDVRPRARTGRGTAVRARRAMS